MIGKVLGGRYEIIEKLGGGGMSVVYKGRDTLLNRVVTIKVLREQFASDQDFVRRFEREAQAVASLSHPNIVSIYDVGQQDDAHYLVIEYVKGATLKDYIREHAPLGINDVVGIAIQICDALEHAHENGIIHRDIKPQNILLTPSGRVKVTDFGIARASTAATVTYTGSIVGSVHYLSPEQAKGETADEKSDIYAAGVVLYEMTTGQLPYSGETPITIALKHIQDTPPPPHEVRGDRGDTIPPALEEVILRAMEKDYQLRYETAVEMRTDLVKIKNMLQSDDDPTEVFSPVNGRSKKTGRTQKRRLRPVAYFTLLLLLIAAGYAGYYTLESYFNVAEIEVPNVVGDDLAEAQKTLNNSGLHTSVATRRYDKDVPEGAVIEQDPKAGEKVKRGRTLELDVSLGAKLTAVPDVKGQAEREARISLANAGFKVAPDPQRIYDDEVEADKVISQDPLPNTKHPEGTEVILVISRGPQPEYISMPDLAGLTLEQAREKLKDVRLDLGQFTFQNSKDYFSGQIISQDVASGDRILQGHTVNLVISSGPGPTPQQALVSVLVPNDDKQHQVRIVVVDVKGTHEEYNKLHESGDYVQEWVPFYKRGKIQVFMDDELAKEHSVP
ncbi:Stk1 family PASTA domain-containing Ser/Thr kinase [Metallumcola ferriviriculae]|uniref:non-specific serine/threonine protein kinase n=1 Tax=Metallumcola ferriviriculae TaxID=3039180 RepID=A0AAU0UPP8_9FIRM|nr:Stk1 family PASTA domain-containing Ser/Thr kinase [Desulfitibacteraceae bacterium MK1]